MADKDTTLKACVEVFEQYEKHHQEKGTHESLIKAVRNAQMAKMCREATDWRPIDKYQPGHDPQKVLGWASLQVWPYCNSPDFTRPNPYWTDWKEWTFYHDGMRWKAGTSPIESLILKVRITHWMPRLSAPLDFDETVYQEGYHN